jgi:hypothetical protein
MFCRNNRQAENEKPWHITPSESCSSIIINQDEYYLDTRLLSARPISRRLEKAHMIAALNRLGATYYKHAARRFFAGFAYDLFEQSALSSLVSF